MFKSPRFLVKRDTFKINYGGHHRLFIVLENNGVGISAFGEWAMKENAHFFTYGELQFNNTFCYCGKMSFLKYFFKFK